MKPIVVLLFNRSNNNYMVLSAMLFISVVCCNTNHFIIEVIISFVFKPISKLCRRNNLHRGAVAWGLGIPFCYQPTVCAIRILLPIQYSMCIVMIETVENANQKEAFRNKNEATKYLHMHQLLTPSDQYSQYISWSLLFSSLRYHVK